LLKDDEIQRFRAALLAERAGLAADNPSSAEDRATVSLDQQSVGRLSRMDAIQRQAMAQAKHAVVATGKPASLRHFGGSTRVNSGSASTAAKTSDENASTSVRRCRTA
jgi:hypothetical protein